MPYLYAAIATVAGKPAGFICYGRTKDDARARARRRTTSSFVVKREFASEGYIARLVQRGELDATASAR
jgi:hypothetical protein